MKEERYEATGSGSGINIGISGSNSSITMQRIVCEGKGNGEEQRADVLREKERSGRERKGLEGRDGRPTSEERKRDRGPAQKRANVGKIGGGSLQLLAGMSGNAWDSILKARPRQSSPSSHRSFFHINGYSVRPLPCTG